MGTPSDAKLGCHAPFVEICSERDNYHFSEFQVTDNGHFHITEANRELSATAMQPRSKPKENDSTS